MVKKKEFPVELNDQTSIVKALIMATGNEDSVKEAFVKRDYGLKWILSLVQAEKMIESVLQVIEISDYKSPNRPVLLNELDIIRTRGNDAIICTQGTYLFFKQKDNCLYGTIKSPNVEISRIWYVRKSTT